MENEQKPHSMHLQRVEMVRGSGSGDGDGCTRVVCLSIGKTKRTMLQHFFLCCAFVSSYFRWAKNNLIIAGEPFRQRFCPVCVLQRYETKQQQQQPNYIYI